MKSNVVTSRVNKNVIHCLFMVKCHPFTFYGHISAPNFPSGQYPSKVRQNISNTLQISDFLWPQYFSSNQLVFPKKMIRSTLKETNAEVIVLSLLKLISLFLYFFRSEITPRPLRISFLWIFIQNAEFGRPSQMSVEREANKCVDWNEFEYFARVSCECPLRSAQWHPVIE